MLEPQRVADGDRDLSNAQRARVSQRRPWQLRAGADANDGEIGVRIAADDVGLQLAAIRQRHSRPLHASDDVSVGDDEAVGGEDRARSMAVFSRDPYDGRANDLHRADYRTRIRVEKSVVVSQPGNHPSMIGARGATMDHPKE